MNFGFATWWRIGPMILQCAAPCLCLLLQLKTAPTMRSLAGVVALAAAAAVTQVHAFLGPAAGPLLHPRYVGPD